MKEIPITRKDGTTYVVQVDDEDYDRVVAAGPWRIYPGHRTYYAIRHIRRAQDARPMHRFLLGDACVGLEVDHIDGNGLNNQRANLRVATKAENQRNRRAQLSSKSGLKGVSWHGQNQRWQAEIRLNGIRLYLGIFDTAEEAHTAYCEAAVQLYGEFARFK